MTADYPKMLFAAAGRGTVSVNSPEEERERLDAGYVLEPGDAHREPQRTHAPEIPAGVALTEAHVPLIVDQVVRAMGGVSVEPRADGVEPLTTDHIGSVVETLFDRLKGMAVAAAGEPAHREASEAVTALHEGLDARFGALKADLLGEIRALIAPAPTAGKKA